MARAIGWVRVTHPFPSVLDGIVSGAVAAIAGAAPDVVLRVGAAMTIVQLGIGALNDAVDAPHDAGHKPGKPIPAGLVTARAARVVAVMLFVGGTVLAATVRPALSILTLIVVAIGLAYDLVMKGTPGSWVPFAVGIPILPVYGWLGARGDLAAMFAVVVPAAVAAGAALAVGNALVDVERDREAGDSSVAVALGAGRATIITVLLLGVVAVLASASAAVGGGGPVAGLAIAILGAAPIAAAVVGRRGTPRRREWAWRAEAVGLALLTVAWAATVLPGEVGR